MSTLQHKQVKSQKQHSRILGAGGRGADGRRPRKTNTPVYNILDYEIPTGANADIVKTKRDCLFCREVDEMLIARLKSQSAREASHYPAFMGNYTTVSHTC